MNVLKRILFVLGLVVFFSCNKQLDLPPDGRIEQKEIFTSYNKTRGYLNSCYGFCPSPGTDRASMTDDSHDAEDVISNSRYLSWYKGNVTSGNFGSIIPGGSPWGRLYRGIRKCNVFLANIWKTPDFELADTTIKKGWEAQALTLRALYYLELIKRYGAVPLLKKELPLDADYGKIQRAPVSKIIQSILDDCRKALEAPDVRDGFPWRVFESSQNRMMNRAITYAIMSEAAIYAVSPLFDDGTFTLEQATNINAAALQALLEHGYKLFDQQPTNGTAVNAYALYFLTNPNNRAVDKETVYSLGAKQQIWRYSGLPSTPNQERAGHCPTQELVDCYEMKNGELPILGYQDPNHLDPIINPASGYDKNNPYANRDPRFYATIFYNGAAKAPAQASGGEYPLTLQIGTQNAMNVSESDGTYQIQTTGGDPFIQTSTLSADINSGANLKLTFEYKSATGISNPELFFSPIAGGRSTVYSNIPVASDWTAYSIDITGSAGQFNWGSKGNNLRFDMGSDANKEIFIRNIKVVATVSSNKVETFVGGADEISSSKRRNTRTGYYLRKYYNHASSISNQVDGYTRLFRLAEIYLNFAEAAYQFKGPDAVIATGSLNMSARDAVNAVRHRAGMPNLPVGMTKEEFKKRYRNERRVEFAFEEQRYFDVRRWKILDKTGKLVTGMRIEKENGNSFSYHRFKVTDRNAWQDKFLLYPIDKSEVDKMYRDGGQDWQNLGWVR